MLVVTSFFHAFIFSTKRKHAHTYIHTYLRVLQ